MALRGRGVCGAGGKEAHSGGKHEWQRPREPAGPGAAGKARRWGTFPISSPHLHPVSGQRHKGRLCGRAPSPTTGGGGALACSRPAGQAAGHVTCPANNGAARAEGPEWRPGSMPRSWSLGGGCQPSRAGKRAWGPRPSAWACLPGTRPSPGGPLRGWVRQGSDCQEPQRGLPLEPRLEGMGHSPGGWSGRRSLRCRPAWGDSEVDTCCPQDATGQGPSCLPVGGVLTPTLSCARGQLSWTCLMRLT